MATRAGSDVWAAIVTHNRRDAVAETVESVLAQSRPPTGIVVVDNASKDGTVGHLNEVFGDRIEVVAGGDNGGYAAGINQSIEAVGDRADRLWVLNDDSPAEPDALDRLLRASEMFPSAGIVGSTGYWLRRGTPRRVSFTQAGRCDCVLIDSTILDLAAVARVGGLRGDFFMMWEEFELSRRLARAGFDVVALPSETSDRRTLGSTDANIWRGYYHSRNQLRDAIDRSDGAEAFFAVVRHLKLAAAALLYPEQHRRWARAGLRLLGLLDAVRNRMGRVSLPRWAGPHPG